MAKLFKVPDFLCFLFKKNNLGLFLKLFPKVWDFSDKNPNLKVLGSLVLHRAYGSLLRSVLEGSLDTGLK